MSKQIGMFKPKSEWVPPMDFPNIKDADKIAIDLETKDPNIIEKGPGWATNDGEIIGVAKSHINKGTHVHTHNIISLHA